MFPNESDAYRSARNDLLDAEIDLRRQLEAVAAKRRLMPLTRPSATLSPLSRSEGAHEAPSPCARGEVPEGRMRGCMTHVTVL
jgi:Bacterial protein of unknown function (DUF899)